MDKFFSDIFKLKERVKNVYIYGAGIYGQNIYKILADKNISIDGFILTNNEGVKSLFDLPVYGAREILKDEVGIITGVNAHNLLSVLEVLKSFDVSQDNILFGHRFIEKYGIRGGYDEKPTIEITTTVGCSVNCKYCPQGVLVTGYYNEHKRPKYMTLEVFEQCLNNFPRECTIIFSGMAEPFLNSNCLKMLTMACESGRQVDLYTTLLGAKFDTVMALGQLPLNFVTLHVADKYNYAHIPVNEEYYRKIEWLLHHTKRDGSNFVNVCNAQDEPDARIKEICDGKYEILTTMLDRAGNLSNPNLFSKRNLHGSISCSICGDKLNHNILLPDGTVLMCCMDYGMKHVFGNLLKQSYDEIMNSTEYQRVKSGMSGNENVEILCRNCSCANAI